MSPVHVESDEDGRPVAYYYNAMPGLGLDPIADRAEPLVAAENREFLRWLSEEREE